MNFRKSEQSDSTVTDFILRINPVESISELTNVVLSFFFRKNLLLLNYVLTSPAQLILAQNTNPLHAAFSECIDCQLVIFTNDAGYLLILNVQNLKVTEGGNH